MVGLEGKIQWSKFWYYAYRTADGRRLKKSTKETDRSKAKIIGEALETAEDLAKRGNATEDQIRRLLNVSVPPTPSGGLAHFWSSRPMKEQNEAGRPRKRRRGEEVERLVDEFEASGSSSTAFCRSRGLALSTLQRHLRARRLGSETRSAGCHLVAVSVAPRTEVKPKAGETGLEVLLPGGGRIGVRPGFDPATLHELITVLERA